MLSSNSLPLLKCLHSTHSLQEDKQEAVNHSFQASSWIYKLLVQAQMCADSLLHGAGVRAGGTLVACGAVCTGLGALARPAHTLAPTAAQQTQAGHAGVSTSGAVAVLALPVWCTLAEATVTDTMAWRERREKNKNET